MKPIGMTIFCKKCNKYPKQIVEKYDWAIEERTWNEETDSYELDDSKYGDMVTECGDCGSVCEENTTHEGSW